MAQTPKVQFANVNSGTTDANVVTAVPLKSIVVVGGFLVSGGTATNVTFNSKGSGAGNAITCLIANGANGGAVFPYNEQGWFRTVAGESLTITTGSGSATGVQINYLEI